MTVYRSIILEASRQLLDAVQSCTASYSNFTTKEVYSTSKEAYEETREIVASNSECTIQLLDITEY